MAEQTEQIEEQTEKEFVEHILQKSCRNDFYSKKILSLPLLKIPDKSGNGLFATDNKSLIISPRTPSSSNPRNILKDRITRQISANLIEARQNIDFSRDQNSPQRGTCMLDQ
jgi:hypothetical protein